MRFIVAWGLLLLLTIAAPSGRAQEEPATPEEPAGDEQPATPEPAVPEPVAPPEPVEGEGQRHFGLYLSVSAGSASADELNTSLAADDINVAIGSTEITDLLYAQAAIGWQLPENQGDFRVVFQGYNETEYSFLAAGVQNRIAGLQATELIPWWFLSLQGGKLTAAKFTPMWSPTDYLRDPITQELVLDANGNCQLDPAGERGSDFFATGNPSTDCNNLPEFAEVAYDFDNPNSLVVTTMPDDLQNQIQTVDLLYGREFGGRRYSSRWFGGFRYFAYEGTLPAAAWMNLDTPGAGFTDGGFLRLLPLRQETTGFGPTGTWEVDFNFLDKGIQLFIVGQAAFTFNSMELDSGPFPQVDINISGGAPEILFEDRLQKSQDKSTWQNSIQGGVRVNLKNGLHFEAAYGIHGYLDIILTPNLLQLGVQNKDPQTTTQDFVFDTFHAGVGFQF